MKTLCAIGEALIDFIPETKGQRLKDVITFKRVAGGAPANVAGAVARLGGKARFLTQLGNDAFGDYIIDCLKESGIDTTFIKQTSEFDTSLAFVSLADDGNRDFKFYRRSAADLQFTKEDIKKEMLADVGYVHFCSVSLVDFPMKQAHIKLIEEAIKQDIKISFDPNLRLSLWDDDEALKKTVLEFIPYADILKISDEELEFITGYKHIEDALPMIFKNRTSFVIYTMGKDGAYLYTKDGRKLFAPSYEIEVKDTTGAGDSFIGAFLYKLLENESDFMGYEEEALLSYLKFANLYAAYTTTKEGALGAMANQKEIQAFEKALKK